MDSKLSFFMDPHEWRQMLNELEFLLREVYGEDFKKSHSQMLTQVPNILAFLVSMVQFNVNPSDLEITKIMQGG